MSVQLRESSAMSSLSIAPLIDVVFLLLIFFLVTSRFEKQERELDLELPEASQSVPITETPSEIVVNLGVDGQLVIDGSIRGLDELEKILAQASANNPLTQTVLIRSDRRAPVGSFIGVINVCKELGLNYTEATEDE
ncbi:MAG: biopolymer transporter ExbD [Planctomycetota bacterium]|nr:biopolymer transporter ExbD [Pirellulaceae bacterium]MEC7109977.1 biopolymer transporter ExbD [Planctomycetota bacterium]MDP7377469.1 biopolymer transporter ExbD [Pirellulaceae bacterium]MEC7446119.1 biopolymer transporter ExbD [Planctomycetota bacterium]MEC7448948.1 biopolymer transporter ExbD [Planctomycetota bacterium]